MLEGLTSRYSVPAAHSTHFPLSSRDSPTKQLLIDTFTLISSKEKAELLLLLSPPTVTLCWLEGYNWLIPSVVILMDCTESGSPVREIPETLKMPPLE